jgi:hypothetical protein
MPTQRQLRRNARLQAKIRFGGELSALAQMLSDAQMQRSSTIQNARGGASSLVQTLEELRPKVGQAYGQAEASRAQASQEADSALAGLAGPQADAIRAARARERASASEQLAGAQAATLTDVGNRQVSARAGGESERRQAEAAYRQDSSKIFGSLAGLQDRRGAFIETTLSDLTEKQRARAVQQENLALDRNQFEHTVSQDTVENRRADQTLAETKRANRADERQARRNARDKRRNGGSGSGKPSRGLGALTPEQEGAHVDKIGTARKWAQKLRQDGNSERDIRDTLSKGAKVTDDQGQTITIPAYSDLHLNAALDLVYHKHLTRPNVRRLHSRGIHIPGAWRRRKK